MSMTAKMKLDRKYEQFTGASNEETTLDQVTLYWGADYEDPANKQWAKYTPGISLTMTVLPEVAEKWSVGDKVTLVFEKSEQSSVPQSDPVEGSLSVGDE